MDTLEPKIKRIKRLSRQQKPIYGTKVISLKKEYKRKKEKNKWKREFLINEGTTNE